MTTIAALETINRTEEGKGEEERLDALLLLPPQWTPLCVYYALPILAGEIRQAGHSCEIRDLNIEYFNYCLTPEYLDWCRVGAEARRRDLYLDFINGMAEGRAEVTGESSDYLLLEGKIQQAELNWDMVISNIEQAKHTMRDKQAFYQPNRLQRAFDVITKALEIASLPFYPSRIMLRDFQNRNLKMTLESIMEAVDNQHENPFIEWYRQILPGIQAQNPRVIGLSINATSQIVAGLTLAKLIKETMPDTRVVIGGNFFTRVVDALLDKPQFFDLFCDALVYEEGEGPFNQFIRAVKLGMATWALVPNILYKVGDTVKKNAAGCYKPLNEIAEPVLDGLDLGAYLAPEIVIPIQASRGCYWKKCTFCDHDFGANFNIKGIDKLIAEIKVLREKYGIRHFEFIDEAISPLYLRKMCQAFIENDLDIRFFMYARTERGFSQELLDLAYRAGCRMILWGVESGNQRIMKLIDKGVPLDESRFDPLRRANQAGIWNFCFVFFGFPTETAEEALDTVHMIMDHKDIINSYGLSHFTLGKHTRLRAEPEKYAITNVREDGEDLSTKLYYDVTEGMTRDEVLKMTDLCTEICNQVYQAPLWFSIGFREFLHLYLEEYGLEYVKRFSYVNPSRAAKIPA